MKVLVTSSLLLLFFLILYSGITFCEGKKKKSKETKHTPKKTPPKLNTDTLPNITEILTSLELSHRELALRKKGVSETRHLLRLEKMDYHMMAFEWDGDAVTDVEKLKKKAAELLPLAIVTEEVGAEKDERHKYKLGRVYIPGFVKSFEYTSASFGLPPPLGPVPIVLADPLDGCEPMLAAEGKMLVVTRGKCTFLRKSLAAKKSGAKLLVIVNSEDKLESVTTGYGIDKSIKYKDIEILNKFSVISTANTSLAPLLYAENITQTPLMGHVVPLKCGKLSKCAPTNAAEKAYQYEVSWGQMEVISEGKTSGRSFNFLTSNFGGLIPRGLIPLSVSPAVSDACSSLSPLSFLGDAVLVTRGNCPFDAKVMNVQNAGGSVVVIEDPLDRPLQRIGGSHPLDGMAGIPSIAIPYHCSEYIRDMVTSNGNVSINLRGSNDSSVADKWIEVSYTQWAEKKKDKLTQLEGMLKKYEAESQDIALWIKRRIKDVESSYELDEL